MSLLQEIREKIRREFEEKTRAEMQEIKTKQVGIYLQENEFDTKCMSKFSISLQELEEKSKRVFPLNFLCT